MPVHYFDFKITELTNLFYFYFLIYKYGRYWRCKKIQIPNYDNNGLINIKYIRIGIQYVLSICG